MTVSSSTQGHADDRSLAAGASPAAVRAALLPEDRDEFLAAYATALDEARTTLQLAPVHSALEEWRRRAIAQSDPEAFRRTVRRAAEMLSGEPVPADERFDVTRAKAGM